MQVPTTNSRVGGRLVGWYPSDKVPKALKEMEGPLPGVIDDDYSQFARRKADPADPFYPLLLFPASSLFSSSLFSQPQNRPKRPTFFS